MNSMAFAGMTTELFIQIGSNISRESQSTIPELQDLQSAYQIIIVFLPYIARPALLELDLKTASNVSIVYQ